MFTQTPLGVIDRRWLWHWQLWQQRHFVRWLNSEINIAQLFFALGYDYLNSAIFWLGHLE